MKTTFLTWLVATRKRDARIAKQYVSNIPKGIV